jgi:predicted restriction endonuclease
MPIQKLEKINPGSIVCGVDDPTMIYKVIEKLTVFDGYDCVGDFSYGVSKTIARLRRVNDNKVYRYSVNRKMRLIQDDSGMTFGKC